MIATYLALGGAVLIAGLFYWRWAKETAAEIADSAGLEWARLKASEPDLVDGIDEARFRAIFHRVHFPRFTKYALAMAAAFIAALPLTLGLLSGLALALEAVGLSADAGALARAIPISGSTAGVSRGDSETIALYYVQDVLKFYYYFGLIFAWLAIVYVGMRRYHKRRPGYLADELLQEKSKG
jgi:hypothetical protein